MRVLLAILLVLGVSVALTSSQAGEKNDVTLKGKICCAKCELGVETECMTVIVTKKKDKDVTVYFNAPSNKTHHSSICSEAKNGTVTGALSDDGKKKVIAVKSLKFD